MDLSDLYFDREVKVPQYHNCELGYRDTVKLQPLGLSILCWAVPLELFFGREVKGSVIMPRVTFLY